MEHLELVSRAKGAIDALMADTSVCRETTRESLEELRELIEDNLNTIEDA